MAVSITSTVQSRRPAWALTMMNEADTHSGTVASISAMSTSTSTRRGDDGEDGRHGRQQAEQHGQK